jgi:hypothetical protein
MLVGVFIVFGGYFVWTGFLSFLEDQGNITAQNTREAERTSTAELVTEQRPTLFFPATFTPLPECQIFRVIWEKAVYRECPSEDNEQCPYREVVNYGTEFCVYGRAPENPEWYAIDLNPGGAFRDMVYMHEEVLKAVNPTPTITPTFTALPTVTSMPSPTPLPTVEISPTPTPNPALPPTPTPTLTPSATPPEVVI